MEKICVVSIDFIPERWWVRVKGKRVKSIKSADYLKVLNDQGIISMEFFFCEKLKVTK